jgi:hypothetical protein
MSPKMDNGQEESGHNEMMGPREKTFPREKMCL